MKEDILSGKLREQHLRRVEDALSEAIAAARIAGLSDRELLETVGHNIRTVLLCGLMLLVLQSYLGIAYKNFVIPMLSMVIFVVGIYNLMHFADNGTLLLFWISGITMPNAMYRLLRQQS